ncbi:HD domain-containing protein [Micropruina sonneratiae]|uniref:HD domain-containing protein n=1 Tax=Micropruina sonneratiae TaxID=2986940 RepID=UPI002225E40B|nr:HD domain-containing protein [Micropruina sp. KQZ13P-5]MCW3158502.1 HD domain-containing protein [Micropruina sp. KQZ13P-5]
MPELPPRAIAWAETMAGHSGAGVVRAHASPGVRLEVPRAVLREQREAREEQFLVAGATRAVGAGERAREEAPDAERTCFERDRDRIVHSTAFRRLAGKTQVVVHPTDHQRTRLTHALEVAQVATSIARGVGVNVTLAEAIALGHDCGHGPGGHASEDAFDAFLPEGYDHGPWGADVVLTPLNLCVQTLDGIRNHSWSRPTPATVEGEIVSWADRIAYCAHDLEDAIVAGIVTVAEVPDAVVEVVGATRREQLSRFIREVIATTVATGSVGMRTEVADALATLRAFNYERIYTRPESLVQSDAVIAVLRALVEFYLEHPVVLPEPPEDPERLNHAAVAYVGGMTDRFAFDTAVALLGWDPDRLPRPQ